MKYIKYLISFLLVFGLTVNECSINSPLNSEEQHQVSYVNNRKQLRHKHSRLYVYARKTLSKKVCIVLITYRNLQNVYSKQTRILLKLRMNLYQKIDSKIAQNVFLNKRNASNNQYSSLYIA